MIAPIYVGELEICEPIRAIDLSRRERGGSYNGARLLVRMQRAPVGYATLAADACAATDVAEGVWRQLSHTINARRARCGLAELAALPAGGLPREARMAEDVADCPFISVVVCTRDRPRQAADALRRILAQRYPAFEIVVVDNAPRSEATAELLAAEFGGEQRIKYVREPKPGLSFARNRGVRESAGGIVAFTDDDAEADPWWLDGLARGFGRAADVGCVTGLVRSAALDNAAQVYFEQRNAWGVSCEWRVFDLGGNRDDSPLYPYSAGVFGTGANFAMTRWCLDELGGFDEALGAGTPCGGGEDLDVFMRTVLAGHRLVYEPSAIVSHFHRTELGELTRQMTAYGSGCTAALTAVALRRRKTRIELLTRLAVGVVRIAAIGERTKGNATLPPGLVRRELYGMALGPWLYLRGRRNCRRLAAGVPRPLVSSSLDAQAG